MTFMTDPSSVPWATWQHWLSRHFAIPKIYLFSSLTDVVRSLLFVTLNCFNAMGCNTLKYYFIQWFKIEEKTKKTMQTTFTFFQKSDWHYFAFYTFQFARSVSSRKFVSSFLLDCQGRRGGWKYCRSLL